MQHLDLWFDLAVRGEPNLGEEALVRFQLTDGADPDPDPQPDDRGHDEPASPSEFF
ncbi:MAG: hypothetical protein ACRELZ_18295 [Candidatus Rokuibacteriota bacterium]